MSNRELTGNRTVDRQISKTGPQTASWNGASRCAGNLVRPGMIRKETEALHRALVSRRASQAGAGAADRTVTFLASERASGISGEEIVVNGGFTRINTGVIPWDGLRELSSAGRRKSAGSGAMLLEGKVAIVTGAGSGIGAAITRLFAAEGARLVLGDLAEDGAGALSAELTAGGAEAVFQQVDVTSETSVARLVEAAVTRFRRLDIMVANAGVAERKSPIHELDIAEWRRVIDVNLTGVAICNKFAAAAMFANGGGAIVNMASILGHVGQENSNAYSAAKAAVVNLTRSVAVTYAKQGIRANCIAPGYVDTPLLAKVPEATWKSMLLRQPIGRLGRPEEIAQIAAFIASDKASLITGASIIADGGYTAI